MSILSVLQQYAPEVTPMEAYREIFKLDDENERCTQLYGADVETRDLVANPLGYCKNDDKEHGFFRVMFFDTFEKELLWLQQFDFAIISGLSYFGRRTSLKHASKLFAFIIDLDGQTEETLNNFFRGCYADDPIYPLPNFIVCSGHGVHLYYVMQEPVSLYPAAKKRLREFKYDLTRLVWNQWTSTEEHIQYQGIAQGFRVIGGKTKIEGFRSRAFRFNEHPWTLEGLNEFFLDPKKRISAKEMLDWQKYQTTTKLPIAKEKWPDWYQKRIVLGLPKEGFLPNRRVYDWWKRKIAEGATLGHRYFCIMCLAIFAIKCGVSKEEVEKDAKALIPRFNAVSRENPFTEDDVKHALRCYDKKYRTFPRDSIAKISGIDIQQQKRRPKGKRLSQEDHLDLARMIRDKLHSNWRDGNGRKPKQQVVQEWRAAHPGGRKADCQRETGLSKPTVLKWWDKEDAAVEVKQTPTPEDREKMLEQFYSNHPSSEHHEPL